MTDNIFGNRFLGFRFPAWHKLGRVFETIMTAVEGVKESGSDFQIVKVPHVAVTPWGEMPTADFGLWREPVADDNTPRHFGTVSKDYEVIQNIQLAQFVDRLNEAGTMRLETVGALEYGKTIFILMAGKDFSVAGDEMKGYRLFTDTRDGSTGLTVAKVYERVVCRNTLNIALRGAEFKNVYNHAAGLSDALDFKARLVNAMVKEEEASVKTFDKMACKIFDPAEIEKVMEAAYPMPTKPRKVAELESVQGQLGEDLSNHKHVKNLQSAATQWEYLCRKALENRENAMTMLVNYTNQQVEPNTGWAVLNAVTEYEDWRDGGEASEKDIEISRLFGLRNDTKNRAYAAIESMSQDVTTR